MRAIVTLRTFQWAVRTLRTFQWAVRLWPLCRTLARCVPTLAPDKTELHIPRLEDRPLVVKIHEQ